MLPTDVDYRVMVTFLEFYETMLQFVNFKLYHMRGLRYPPTVDQRMEAAAEELAAIMRDLAGVQGAVDQQVQEQQQLLKQLEKQEAGGKGGGMADGEGGEEEEEDSEDDGMDGSDDNDAPVLDSGDDEEEEEEEEEPEEAAAAGDDDDDALALMDARRRGKVSSSSGLKQRQQRNRPQGDDDEEEERDGEAAAGGALGVDADDEASVCGALFSGLVFFLAREVPREPLLFVVRAFGGTVAWAGEGSPMQEADERITHQARGV